MDILTNRQTIMTVFENNDTMQTNEYIHEYVYWSNANKLNYMYIGKCNECMNKQIFLDEKMCLSGYCW